MEGLPLLDSETVVCFTIPGDHMDFVVRLTPMHGVIRGDYMHFVIAGP